MQHLPSEVLGETVLRLLGEVLDEVQVSEEVATDPLHVLLAETGGERVEERVLPLEVELGVDLVVLLDVVVDLVLELDLDLVLLGHLLEGLHAVHLLHRVVFQVGDQPPHVVDVVGQDDAAHHLDERQTHCLFQVGGRQVSEADCQHDGRRPVVAPQVLGLPALVRPVADDEPVPVVVELGHAVEGEGEEVRDGEVGDEDEEELPVLLADEGRDVQVLQQLDVLEQRRKPEVHEEVLDLHVFVLLGQRHDDHRDVGHVEHKAPPQVERRDFRHSRQGSPVLVALDHEVDADLQHDDAEADHVQQLELRSAEVDLLEHQVQGVQDDQEQRAHHAQDGQYSALPAGQRDAVAGMEPTVGRLLDSVSLKLCLDVICRSSNY